jgi:hypothetical protein
VGKFGDSGVGHQNVDLAKALAGGREQPLDIAKPPL